jgi:hypothetical protein
MPKLPPGVSNECCNLVCLLSGCQDPSIQIIKKGKCQEKKLSVFLCKNYDYKMLNFNNKSGSKHYNLPIKPGLNETARTGFSLIRNYSCPLM